MKDRDAQVAAVAAVELARHRLDQHVSVWGHRARTITSALHGVLRDDARSRGEFLSRTSS